ncbi:PcfJ domain-containing protein [Pararhizobium sp. BT-229]|uniref:PcfJ domain-containing protein n=1 Tax=Pararhizobium sp. BT-229 TaxID=2986923 RepID=UPI0021F7A96B|nr:PcfJ domain-containing protein [Pararhizobium sp. BT-229]MCV9963699.1 PcfJ domain-containing protein [Pararhizobium sp. BT-229]
MEDLNSERKSRFGSPVASDMYARLKRLSVDMKVLKVYEVLATETEVRMVIFNSWMITRNLETGAVATFERDYSDGSWHGVEPHGIFHAIPVWPIVNLNQGIAGAAKKYILEKLYKAVNYSELRDSHVARKSQEANRLIASGVEWSEAHELARERFPDARRLEIARNAFADKLFGSKFSRGKRKPPKGFVAHQSVYNALKGVRAEFHRQFRDPELFRAMLAMDRKFMSLGDYLYFAARREAVLKVWGERRNLVPMLPHIGRDYWSDDALFSVANWTNPQGPLVEPGFTAIQVRQVPSQNSGSGIFTPFASARAYRWLARSKNTVVKEWVRNRKDPRVAELMSELNLPKETAALVTANIVGEMANALVQMDQVDFSVDEYRQRLLRTFRTYAGYWAGIRQREGYRAMVAALKYGNDGTRSVFDYLIYEGFAQDLPARNATWASIQTRSRDWHRREYARHRARYPQAYYDDYEDDADLPREWTSLVAEQKISGCLVRPLDKYEEVVAEGQDMSHCVASYASRCASGQYRVYSITEGDGERSTLGISLYGGTAYFDQVQGFGNSRPSQLVRQVAEKVVAMYAEAIAAESTPDRQAA